MTITDTTDPSRCCCSCGHNTRDGETGLIRCHCDIDGHYIGYIASFESVCENWKGHNMQGSLDNISEIVYTNIKSLAKTTGKSMSDVEKDLDVSPGYLSRASKGTKHLSIDVCYKASLYFDIPLADLIRQSNRTD